MKKITASAGLAALGMIGLTGAYAQNYGLAQLTPQESSKPFSLGATLRGFYDDNYNTLPKATARESFGFEISPSASLNFPLEQTYIGLSYIYTLKWFEDRVSDNFDQTHQFTANLNHAFSERYKVDLHDSFVVAQEPEVLDPGSAVASPLRTTGSNLRNHGGLSFTAGLTPMLSVVLGYANTYYDYEQDASEIASLANPTGAGSRSALLDRIEHVPSLNLRYQIVPTTSAILGYQYEVVDFNSKDLLTTSTNVTAASNQPESRNSTSHYIFLGADHSFTEQLSGSVRGGGQFTEYPNAASGTDNILSPYGDLSGTWRYNPGSYVQLGVRHALNRTDVAFDAASPNPSATLSQESTTVYAALNHQITASLTASLLGQAQFSSFNDGFANNQSEQYYVVGLNLSYRFNQFLAAEAGYNYDRLETDLPNRAFSRNRIYVGVRANY